MMRLIFVLGAIMLLAGCATTDIGGAAKPISYPVDAGCHAVPYPRVRVDMARGGPVEDRSISYRVLSQTDSDGKGPAAKRNRNTFGATKSEVLMQGSYAFDNDPASDGQTCVWLSAAKLTLTWVIAVNIASEIEPGSCPDLAVREHEAKHVELDRELEDFIMLPVQEVLSDHGGVSILAPTALAGELQLQNAFNKMVEDTVANFVHDRDQQQIAIDTPEEYDRVQRQCDSADWVKLVR